MTPLVWIDLEMTGLFPDSCHILEIASVVTDSNLEVLGVGPDIVIHQSDQLLEDMNPWCVVQHGESGLTQAVRDSQVSQDEAEAQTLAFLREHTTAGVSPMCGNSIALDWRFLQAHMPGITAFTQGQLVDVTTIKELGRRWFPSKKAPDKSESHRAREDILESIAELKFYREHLFRKEAG